MLKNTINHLKKHKISKKSKIIIYLPKLLKTQTLLI